MRAVVQPVPTAEEAAEVVSPSAWPRRRALPEWLFTPVGTAVLLTALVGLATLLRLEGQRQWFWIDEGLSAGISHHHLSAILPSVC